MKALPLLLAAVVACLDGAVSAQTDYDRFVKAFDQAIKFNNDTGLAKAIRGQPAQAIQHFEALVLSSMRTGKGEKYKVELGKLRSGFVAAFEVKTLDHVERFYRNIDSERINLLYKAEENRTKLYNEWLKLKTAGDRKGILQLVEQGALLGRRMEELGHRIKAAAVYGTLAAFLNTIPKHTEQDTKDTIDFAKMFMAQRDSWEWNKDTLYYQWKRWVDGKLVALADEKKKAEERKKAGLTDEGEGLEKLIDRKAPVLVGRLEFKPLKALPEDCCFNGGPVPINWLSTRVTDTPTKMAWFKRRDLYLVRTGSTKIGVSIDGKAESAQAVDAGTKQKPSVVQLSTDKRNPYSLVFFTGGQSEPFAAATTNLAPTKEAVIVYYRSSSSWETKINGELVTFYDDDCDGNIFNTDPLKLGFTTRLTGYGPEAEQPVPLFDSMKIGRKGDIVPYSSAAKIGDTWFLLEGADSSRAVQARPLHAQFFEIGTVTFKWSGSKAVKPQVLILRGRGSLRRTAFNIAHARKPMEIPAGEYDIAFGRAVKGKGSQAHVVHVFKGDSEIVKVEKGKNTEVKLGAPFRFDFKKEGDENEVVVNSLYFKVKGVSGEVYGKVQGPTPAPEVVIAKTASGRGAKVMGSYIPITGAELLNLANTTLADWLKKAKPDVRGMGVNVGYFPIVKGDRSASTILRFKVPFTGALVGLRLKKKHKMFGKIEPVFK